MKITTHELEKQFPPHARLTIFLDGMNVGTLTIAREDKEEFIRKLGEVSKS